MQLQLTTNEQKNGLELRFEGKPSIEVTTLLNQLGFKYSYPQQLWYGKNTEQKQQFATQLSQALAREGDLEEIEIIPSFSVSEKHIEERKFSCVKIIRKSEQDGDITQEFLMFEPCLKSAREIARRFALGVFGDIDLTITVRPRTGKKLARKLLAESRIIQSSKQGLVGDALKADDYLNADDQREEKPAVETPSENNTPSEPLEEFPLAWQQESTKEVTDESSLEKSDEEILEELYNMNRAANLSRSFLKQVGIKHPLKGWHITIGKYCLERKAVFRFVFDLSICQTTSESALDN